MIFSFIRALFSKKKKKEVDISPKKEVRSDSPDFIDYDGMGNQGRFPSVRKK